jgi:hypothetical protein
MFPSSHVIWDEEATIGASGPRFRKRTDAAASTWERRKTYASVGTLIVGHPQQARAGLMHLVFVCGYCSRRRVRLVARISLVAVDRGRAGRRRWAASERAGGGARGSEVLKVRLRGRRGGAAFEDGGGAGELSAALVAQQREAREGQTPAVGAGAGSWRCGEGRRRVGGRGHELIRLLSVVGGLAGGVAGGGVPGAGAGRLGVNKDGGGRGCGREGHGQRNERSSQGHRR